MDRDPYTSVQHLVLKLNVAQVRLENVLRANGRVQSKSNSRQEKEAKRIKKEEAAGEADHREDNNKFMKPEQAWTRSDKKFQPQLPPCWK